jgi:tetratricopeptide (TPR) repeat protein
VDENSLAGRIVLAFDRAVERPDVSPLATYNLGRLLLALGALSAASQAYERTLDLDPEMAEAFAGMGELEFLQGRFAECLEWFDEARRRQWMLTATGSLYDRDRMTQRIASGDMTMSQVERYAARALVRLGQPIEANRMMQSAIEWQPWDIDGVRRDIVNEYLVMGQAVQEYQGVEAAIRTWESAQETARQANVHELFLQLGQAYLQMALQARELKDRQKMMAWLERARNMADAPPVAISPDAAPAWNELRAAIKQATNK